MLWAAGLAWAGQDSWTCPRQARSTPYICSGCTQRVTVVSNVAVSRVAATVSRVAARAGQGWQRRVGSVVQHQKTWQRQQHTAGQHGQHQHDQDSRGFPAGACNKLWPARQVHRSELQRLASWVQRGTQLAPWGAAVAPCSPLVHGWEALPNPTLPNHSDWHAGSLRGTQHAPWGAGLHCPLHCCRRLCSPGCLGKQLSGAFRG